MQSLAVKKEKTSASTEANKTKLQTNYTTEDTWRCDCGRENSNLTLECPCKEEENEIDRFLARLDWMAEFDEYPLTDEQDEEEMRRDHFRRAI